MRSLVLKVMTMLLILLALYAQVLIEHFLRWFTPDIFFLLLVFLMLIYKKVDFVSFFIVALFYDVFTNNFFGGTVLAITLTFYFMELARFHNIRFSFLGSSGLIAVFYMIYLSIQHIIAYGVERFFSMDTFYLSFQLLSTVLAWMLTWKIQSR